MQERTAYILIILVLVFIAYKLSKILKYLKKINLNLEQDYEK